MNERVHSSFPYPLICGLAILCGAAPAPAQHGEPTRVSSELAKVLSFESSIADAIPFGWSGLPSGMIFADNSVVHGGKMSARIERSSSSSENFTVLSSMIPMTFSGAVIELKGFLKTENVSDAAILWLRQDGNSGILALDNMSNRELKGTTDWVQCSVKLPVHSDAKQLLFGALLSGAGKVWIDDLELLVDGKPVWKAPAVSRPKTALDTDHEFDAGSKIKLTALSSNQVANLVTLGKVWGFLKYHHPAVTGGKRHFDFDLFRVLPKVLAATDKKTALAAIDAWVASLGSIKPCDPCAQLAGDDIHLRPALKWLTDDDMLGPALGARLREVYKNRPVVDSQFYVEMAPGVGNPIFKHELAYSEMKLPDAGLQILAAYRFSNIIEYWFPYRNIIGENRDDVMARALPRIALADSVEEFEREMTRLVGAVHDGHANMWGANAVIPPTGECRIPAHLRFIEDVPVVVGFMGADSGRQTDLKLGDVILEIDGAPVRTLLKNWRSYYPASNDAARLNIISYFMTRGACGDAKLLVRRGKAKVAVSTRRTARPAADQMELLPRDLPGDTFRMLSDKVAYLKLSSVKGTDVARYIDSAAGARGLIIDIRNYPSDFVVFSLGSLLVDKDTPFVRFTTGDPTNPGAFRWTEALSLPAGKTRFRGKVVILVDETSMSQAEYTAMAFRAAPGAIVVGSRTAGADGNFSAIQLPDGQRTGISGIGVFYPDKKMTQRIGIVADVEVRPTIAGIKADRDEQIEEALRRILGPTTPEDEIRKIAGAALNHGSTD